MEMTGPMGIKVPTETRGQMGILVLMGMMEPMGTKGLTGIKELTAGKAPGVAQGLANGSL